MTKKFLVSLAIAMLLVFGTVLVAGATLINDNMSARVKGTTNGNWEIGLGDRVGEVGNNPEGDPWFVSTNGDDPWVGTNTYDFSLKYSSATGLATFLVSGMGFTSTLLTSPDYDIEGWGFTGIDLGLKTRLNTTLTLSDLILNGSSIGGGYTGTASYITNALYAGSVLSDIDLTGKFVMTGDNSNNNEGTKFDLYLTGLNEVPASVPEPATLLLLGFGLLGVARVCRKN